MLDCKSLLAIAVLIILTGTAMAEDVKHGDTCRPLANSSNLTNALMRSGPNVRPKCDDYFR